MYNIMQDDDVLETRYMFQPRGEGTGWFFRMATPEALRGEKNPRTGRPYGAEIRESLKTRNRGAARKNRDALLGAIRLEEAAVRGNERGSLSEALAYAEEYRHAGEDQRDIIERLAGLQAEGVEKVHGLSHAKRWYRTATAKATPFTQVYEAYLSDRGSTLSHSTKNNLKTAAREFLEFAGEGVGLEGVDRRMVAKFVTEYLPSQKSPKAPDGPGPATIRKKVTLLRPIWQWAMDRGYLEFSPMTPWDRQAPTEQQVRKASRKRRIFQPEEARALLKEAAPGRPLGDIIRVALLTGVRLEEVASLEAEQLDDDCRGYEIKDGKSANAARYVPLVDEAYDVIATRASKVGGKGPLFPELSIRPSTRKRGGSVSQSFTRFRRKVLGKHTDGELTQHCFRHTWRTAARRVGADIRTIQELGGWSRGKESDLVYDHALERDHYRAEQEKIARWLRDQGFLE